MPNNSISYTIRPATPQDAGEILAIYAPYVANTAHSFETEPPTLEEFTRRIEKLSAVYPYLVCESGGRILGFAYGSAYRERHAYRFGAQTSIYLSPGATRKGIGKALYSALLDCLTILGYYIAYAAIVLPNDASIILHEKLGFTRTGLMAQTGFKHGRWWDVALMEKRLREPAGDPVEPTAFKLMDDEALRTVIRPFPKP